MRSACRGAAYPHGACRAAHSRAAPHHCGGAAGPTQRCPPWQHGRGGPRERRAPHTVSSTSAAGPPAGLGSLSCLAPSSQLAGLTLVLLLCGEAVMLRCRASRMRTAHRAGRSAVRRCGRPRSAGEPELRARPARAAARRLAAARQQRGPSGGRLVRWVAQSSL